MRPHLTAGYNGMPPAKAVCSGMGRVATSGPQATGKACKQCRMCTMYEKRLEAEVISQMRGGGRRPGVCRSRMRRDRFLEDWHVQCARGGSKRRVACICIEAHIESVLRCPWRIY
jgi:hypothetical protein